MDFALPQSPEYSPFCAAGGVIADENLRRLARDFFLAVDHCVDAREISGFLADAPLLGQIRRLRFGASSGSALFCAAGAGRLDLVRVLLPFSDPKAVEEDGRSAFSWALSQGHEAVAEVLFPHCGPGLLDASKRNASLQAASVGAITLLRETAPVCDPRERDEAGQDALMRAASRGHADCVSFLLRWCDPLAVDGANLSALDNAAIQGQTATAALLLPCSNARSTASGRDALMFAAAERSASMIRLLLPASDLSARSPNGLSAFDIALGNRRPEIVDAFFDALGLDQMRLALSSDMELPRIRARFEALELSAAMAAASRAAPKSASCAPEASAPRRPARSL